MAGMCYNTTVYTYICTAHAVDCVSLLMSGTDTKKRKKKTTCLYFSWAKQSTVTDRGAGRGQVCCSAEIPNYLFHHKYFGDLALCFFWRYFLPPPGSAPTGKLLWSEINK